MNAEIIQSLLTARSDNDIYIAECCVNECRLDGWAIRKSYSNPLTIGYEIKISKSDFLTDKKWTGYLSYCNELYFVCPSHLIQPNEVGEQVGLMWVASTGTRIYTKKKATYRIVEDKYINQILRSVLFNRCVVRENYWGNAQPDKSTFWKRWLQKKDEDKELGWNVSEKVRQLVEERVDKAKRENSSLRRKIEEFKRLEELLIKLNFNPEYFDLNEVQNRIKGAIPKDLLWTIDQVIDRLDRTKKKLLLLERTKADGQNTDDPRN